MKWMSLLVLVAGACGGSDAMSGDIDTAPDASVPVCPGACDLGYSCQQGLCVPTESMVVSLISERFVTQEFGYVFAQFFTVARPTLEYQADVALADEQCFAAVFHLEEGDHYTLPHEESCGTEEMMLSVAVDGMETSMTKPCDGYQAEIFPGGTEFSIDFGGLGAFSPFQTDIRMPLNQAVAASDVVPGEPVFVSWNPDGADVVTIEWRYRGMQLRCDVPDTGSFEIPRVVLDKISADGGGDPLLYGRGSVSQKNIWHREEEGAVTDVVASFKLDFSFNLGE